MECVDIATKYLHPAFAVTMLLSLFSLWRMKVNAVEGYEEEFKSYSWLRQLLGDFVLPKPLLTKRGKQWHILGTISSIGLTIVFFSYIYFGKQDWVCKWGPDKPPIEQIKNVFKDS